VVQCRAWHDVYAFSILARFTTLWHAAMAQEIVRDDTDRGRFQDDLGKAAIRCSWRVCALGIPGTLNAIAS
jgi:hypothetical protein